MIGIDDLFLKRRARNRPDVGEELDLNGRVLFTQTRAILRDAGDEPWTSTRPS